MVSAGVAIDTADDVGVVVALADRSALLILVVSFPVGGDAVRDGRTQS
jgi:hypothetical protein